MTGGPPPRILLVGAYERDNFGDLLFFLITKRYLRTAHLVPASVIYADMSPLLGEFVVPYAHALQTTKFDAIWVVGGEVGTTTADEALRFSVSAEELRVFDSASDLDREAIARALMGSKSNHGAYVPLLESFPLNAETPLVVNSVGVAGIGSQPADQARRLLQGIRQAESVRVRDMASHRLLDKRTIPNVLAPDLVQTVALAPEMIALAASSSPEGTILFQASTRYLAEVGMEPAAQALVRVARDTGKPIQFFAAGTANMHDSFADYRDLAAHVAQLDPSVHLSTLRERDPWALANAIRSCALWIGTSLHGRIIASAFHRPRVSLVNAKVSNYAATWDPDMPHGVAIDEVRSAALTAMSGAAAGHGRVGDDLCRLADRSMTELMSLHV